MWCCHSKWLNECKPQFHINIYKYYFQRIFAFLFLFKYLKRCVSCAAFLPIMPYKIWNFAIRISFVGLIVIQMGSNTENPITITVLWIKFVVCTIYISIFDCCAYYNRFCCTIWHRHVFYMCGSAKKLKSSQQWWIRVRTVNWLVVYAKRAPFWLCVCFCLFVFKQYFLNNHLPQNTSTHIHTQHGLQSHCQQKMRKKIGNEQKK